MGCVCMLMCIYKMCIYILQIYVIYMRLCISSDLNTYITYICKIDRISCAFCNLPLMEIPKEEFHECFD